MVKKISFSILLLILPFAIFAADSAEVTAVQKAKKDAQRELRFAQKVLSEKVEKVAPALNDKNKAIIGKIIASPAFTKKAEESISSQVERIVKGSSFKDVKTTHNLSNFFTAKVNALLNDFFKAMADIKYCQMLIEKLDAKEKELAAAAPTTTESSSPETSETSDTSSLFND